MRILKLSVDFSDILCYNPFCSRKCRNWQTSKTKDLVASVPCGFKSHLPHVRKFPLILKDQREFFVRQVCSARLYSVYSVNRSRSTMVTTASLYRSVICFANFSGKCRISAGFQAVPFLF